MQIKLGERYPRLDLYIIVQYSGSVVEVCNQAAMKTEGSINQELMKSSSKGVANSCNA